MTFLLTLLSSNQAECQAVTLGETFKQGEMFGSYNARGNSGPVKIFTGENFSIYGMRLASHKDPGIKDVATHKANASIKCVLEEKSNSSKKVGNVYKSLRQIDTTCTVSSLGKIAKNVN